jgi:hypothetical protein
MRTEQLNNKDREVISETPFLRVDKIFYAGLFGGLVLGLIIILTAPILGPRIKPLGWESPKTLDDYFSRLWPYLMMFVLLIMIPLADLLIRWRELKSGTKKITKLKVITKWTTKRWTIIFFDPFHISIFRYFFRLRSVQTGDILTAELTSMNRIIDFTVCNDSRSANKS